jgi:PAS domain-containing protein
MKNTTHLYDYFFILKNLPDGLFIVDNNRVITFWDKTAKKILGYWAEENIIGKSLTILKTPHVSPTPPHINYYCAVDRREQGVTPAKMFPPCFCGYS